MRDRPALSWFSAGLVFTVEAGADAQGRSAPKDALLYFDSWPQNGATIKGAFWCRFGLRSMGVTHAGDNFQNSGHHHLLVDVNEPLNPKEPIPHQASLICTLERARRRLGSSCRPASILLQRFWGDADHYPFNPPVVSKKITITVK